MFVGERPAWNMKICSFYVHSLCLWLLHGQEVSMQPRRSWRGGERVSPDDVDIDGMDDFFHLYDLVHIDVEAAVAEKASQDQAKR